MQAFDVLVEIAFITASTLNKKLGEKVEIQKSISDTNNFLREEYSIFKDNIKEDDIYLEILNKIIDHKYSCIILGLLDSIFLTSEFGKSSNISYLVYKDIPSKEIESVYFRSTDQNIELFEEVIIQSETFMETQTPNISSMVVKTLDTSRINLPELIASKMTAAAAGGKMNL